MALSSPLYLLTDRVVFKKMLFPFLALCFLTLGLEASDFVWRDVGPRAGELDGSLAQIESWKEKDVHYFRSVLSPGVLLRMKTSTVTFFTGLADYGAEPPNFFVFKTEKGTRAVRKGDSVSGAELESSWIVASFQGASGWEQFDTPWFLSFQVRPRSITLTPQGLRIDFSEEDTGYIFSMPLFGYAKPPQERIDFAAIHGLPSLGVRPWEWLEAMPAGVVERCDWWAAVSKSFPIGFQESFSVDPKSDRLILKNRYRWLLLQDDWGTPPKRFAPLSPPLGLAWKIKGFPMQLSESIHDPDYFTAFGPLVGAVDVDELEVSMPVLQYTNEVEHLDVPRNLTPEQAGSLEMIRKGMWEKFGRQTDYSYDYGGPGDYVWNIVGDVWYPRGLPFVREALREKSESSLRTYFQRDVLREYAPHHGKFLMHGPGIGSWGTWGDAGKFMSNALQPIWAYVHFTGDWKLARERWPLIKRYFVTPEEADWTSFGRTSIAELGDEAPPTSAYARLAWGVGDLEGYLFGCYMFARELVLHFVKQKAGPYFYRHQPYNHYEPMPAHIYPTDVWGSTRGWQLDGPEWGHLDSGEHQSANRWIRFQDPDTGRFYRDHLQSDVRRELDWLEMAAKENRRAVYRLENYQRWVSQDQIHLLPSLARLRSFLLNDSPPRLAMAYQEKNRNWRGSKIALGYSLLRRMAPIKQRRLVPRNVEQSPFVLGLERNGPDQILGLVQDIWRDGMQIEPRWHGWPMPTTPSTGGADRSFGTIRGEFGDKINGAEKTEWVSYGVQVHWANGVVPRSGALAGSIASTYLGRILDWATGSNFGSELGTPVAVIGPFPGVTDSPTEENHPPEEETIMDESYPGKFGDVGWKETRFGVDQTLDLTETIFLEDEKVQASIAYALQYVFSPEAMQAFILVGHHGGVRAWVNDNLVIDYHGPHHSFRPDALKGLIDLKKGWNRILVKTETYNRDFKLQFRLVHLDRQPIPDLVFRSDPPDPR